MTKEYLHGTLVQVYGYGIFIIGKPGIGKSKMALDLIDRGHYFIADDICKIDENHDGHANEKLKHHISIRSIGILDISEIYFKKVIEKTKINFVLELTNEMQENAHCPLNNISSIVVVNKNIKKLTFTISNNLSLLLESFLKQHSLKRL